MNANPMPRSPNRLPLARAAARLLPLAAALVAAAPAGAQLAPQNPVVSQSGGQPSSPFYIGASQAFNRDSNVFRTPKGSPESADTISTTSLLAGVDQPFGRQRFQADARVSHNKYRDQDQLDHTGYRFGVGLDWETVGRLSGNVSLVAQQNLARYGVEGRGTTTERNVEKARQFNATAQYGGASILTLYALLDHRAVDYSLVSFNPIEFDRNMVGAGARYRVGGALTLGAEVRTGQGEYPNFAPGVSDDFDRHEVALTAQWVPTGASRINARLGRTKQNHDIDARDFSGTTGALQWIYLPTGKLRFETELRRDTGQEIDPLRIAQVLDAVGDNSVVSNRLQLRTFYEATAKIQLDALLRYTRRKLIDTTTLVTAPTTPFTSAGNDSTTALQIGARYSPTRTVQLGCSIGREQRDASLSGGFSVGAPVSYDYSVDTAGCFAQIVLNP